MQTRRDIIRGGLGLAGIIAAGKAPAAVVKSMLSTRKEIAAGSGDEPLSAKSYIQDGLVAMWDGIENAGWGVHDANATVWKDLSGNGYDANIVSDFTNGHWENDCWNNFTTTNTSSRRGFIVPIEVMTLIAASYNAHTFQFVLQRINISYLQNSFWGSPAENQKFEFTGSGLRLGYWGKQTKDNTATNAILKTTDRHVYSILATPFSLNVYLDTTVANSFTPVVAENFPSPAPTALIRQGSASRAMPFQGRIINIRLYSRALTADEIAANYAVDKARFNLD